MSFTNGDIVKADLEWQVDAIGFAANVFQAILVQSTPHAISDVDAVTDMAAWLMRILEPMEPHIVVTVDVVSASIYKKVGALWNYISDTPVPFTPASAGDPLPSGVAALMTAYTETSRVMGKKYLPGLSEIGQTAGVWVVGVLSAMADSAVEWTTHFAGLADPTSEWYPGVWSLKAMGFRLFSGLVAVRDVPAYQRRRKAGVGI